MYGLKSDIYEKGPWGGVGREFFKESMELFRTKTGACGACKVHRELYEGGRLNYVPLCSTHQDMAHAIAFGSYPYNLLFQD
jgi:hypothetical protein